MIAPLSLERQRRGFSGRNTKSSGEEIPTQTEDGLQLTLRTQKGRQREHLGKDVTRGGRQQTKKRVGEEKNCLHEIKEWT